MKKNKPQRTARSEVILDFDDILILYHLLKATNNKHKIGFILLEDLKKKVNLSHKGILTHLNRLRGHRLIQIGKLSDQKNQTEIGEQDYKFKIVSISESGQKVARDLLGASPDIENRIVKFENDQIWQKSTKNNQK